MYNRAEKGTYFTFTDTPGPAAYTLPSDRDFREENVPFRFKVGHTSVWEPKPGPAPNAYTIKYRKHRIKGAAWSRMTEKKPFAKYQNGSDDDIDADDLFRTAEDARRMKYYAPKQDKPKLCRGRPKDCYPCEEDESKTIKELDIRKFYKKAYRDNMQKCKGCDKYKGPKWSKYRAKRFSEEGEALGPSPTDYDLEGLQHWQWVEGPINEKEWYEDIRFYKRATSKIKRFTDMVECEQAKNDEPSPADTAFTTDFWKKRSFNVKGTFGNPSQKLPPISASEQSEISSTQKDPLSEQPVTKRARKRPPFNVTATRDEKIPEMPGPADYNPPQGTVQFKLCKKLPPKEATYVAPFGTTAVQRPLMVDQGIPDPGTYDARVKPSRVPYGAKTTTFTSRRDAMKSSLNNQISPAYYDMVAVYERMKNGCNPCKKRKPFNSTAPRLVSQNIDFDIPGPTAYTVKDEALRAGARAATNMGKPSQKITADVTSDTPGPGSYNIHPLYKDAVVKAHCTHNVTLVPYPNFYPIKPQYGPPLPKVILKTFVKGSNRF